MRVLSIVHRFSHSVVIFRAVLSDLIRLFPTSPGFSACRCRSRSPLPRSRPAAASAWRSCMRSCESCDSAHDASPAMIRIGGSSGGFPANQSPFGAFNRLAFKTIRSVPRCKHYCLRLSAGRGIIRSATRCRSYLCHRVFSFSARRDSHYPQIIPLFFSVCSPCI